MGFIFWQNRWDHRFFGPVITDSLSPTCVFREKGRCKTACGPIFSAASWMANGRLTKTLPPVHCSTRLFLRAMYKTVISFYSVGKQHKQWGTFLHYGWLYLLRPTEKVSSLSTCLLYLIKWESEKVFFWLTAEESYIYLKLKFGDNLVWNQHNQLISLKLCTCLSASVNRKLSILLKTFNWNSFHIAGLQFLYLKLELLYFHNGRNEQKPEIETPLKLAQRW